MRSSNTEISHYGTQMFIVHVRFWSCVKRIFVRCVVFYNQTNRTVIDKSSVVKRFIVVFHIDSVATV